MTGNGSATQRGRQRAPPLDCGRVTLAVNLGSFAYLVLIARSASPALFGALAALAGITLLFEVPANALQVAVGRALAPRPDGRVASVAARPLLVQASKLGAAACVVLLALSPLVEWFLHLPSITSALLLAAYALPVGVSVVPKGVLVGQGRLRLLATGLITGIAVRIVARRPAGAPRRRARWRLRGDRSAARSSRRPSSSLGLHRGPERPIRHGPPASPFKSAAPARTTRRLRPRGTPPPASPRPLLGATRDRPAVAFTGFWLLTAIDVILARHWLASDASGWYAAGATAAQIALLAPGAIAALTFPRLVGSDVPLARRAGQPAQPAAHVRPRVGRGGAHGFRRRGPCQCVRHRDGQRVLRAQLRRGRQCRRAPQFQQRPARPGHGAPPLPPEPREPAGGLSLCWPAISGRDHRHDHLAPVDDRDRDRHRGGDLVGLRGDAGHRLGPCRGCAGHPHRTGQPGPARRLARPHRRRPLLQPRPATGPDDRAAALGAGRVRGVL